MDRAPRVGVAVASAGTRTCAGTQSLSRRGPPRRRAGGTRQPSHLAGAVQPRFIGPGTGAHPERLTVHDHRRPAGGCVGVPAESVSDLGASARGSAVSGPCAVGQRRLFLSDRRTAAAGRFPGTGPGRHERHRRRISHGEPDERRCALEDRGRAAARRCRG
jgi:hypothetical protein